MSLAVSGVNGHTESYTLTYLDFPLYCLKKNKQNEYIKPKICCLFHFFNPFCFFPFLDTKKMFTPTSPSQLVFTSFLYTINALFMTHIHVSKSRRTKKSVETSSPFEEYKKRDTFTKHQSKIRCTSHSLGQRKAC